jgi:hypothetical protein
MNQGIVCVERAASCRKQARLDGDEGAHGGDFGAAVTTFMALDDPAPMLGIHLSNLDLAPYTGPGSRPLSAAERAYLAQYQRWREDDRGYGAIQSTRPQTHQLRPQRLTSRPGRLDAGEVAGLDRLRRCWQPN